MYNSRHKQKGVATLLTAVVLMIVIFLITYNMSENILAAKRSTSNAVWAAQAFQKAQNGLDYGMAYVVSTGIAATANLASTAPYSIPSALTPEPLYTAVVVEKDGDYINIISTAYSEDFSVKRVVRDRISGSPVLAGSPNVPLMTKGGINLTSGSFKITNNEEALTIWAGGTADVGAAIKTYISVDGTPDQLSNSSTTRGPDIVDNHDTLARVTEKQMLTEFFGVSELADFCEGTDAIRTCNEVGSSGEIITTYYYSDSANPPIDEDGTCGDEGYDTLKLKFSDFPVTSATKPVRIVVEGAVDLAATGSEDLYAVVIAQEVTFSGGANTFYGSIIALDCVDNPPGSGGGQIEFNKTVIDSLSGSGAVVRVSGGWHDWDN